LVSKKRLEKYMGMHYERIIQKVGRPITKEPYELYNPEGRPLPETREVFYRDEDEAATAKRYSFAIGYLQAGYDPYSFGYRINGYRTVGYFDEKERLIKVAEYYESIP
jgi:hypothetical protein